MSIGVHSWFGKYDIVELNCILLFLLSWIIVTAFGALCYKNFRFFLFDACSRQPLDPVISLAYSNYCLRFLLLTFAGAPVSAELSCDIPYPNHGRVSAPYVREGLYTSGEVPNPFFLTPTEGTHVPHSRFVFLTIAVQPSSYFGTGFAPDNHIVRTSRATCNLTSDYCS